MKKYDLLLKKLSKLDKNLEVKTNEPLSRHTSVHIGGPADIFINTSSSLQLENAFLTLLEENIPYFIFGGGSNIIVGDKGFRGAVIKVSHPDIKISEENIKFKLFDAGNFRKQETSKKRVNWLKWDDLMDNLEQYKRGKRVTVFSGTPLSYLIAYTLNKGITGLELFSGIPGNVGGAVWNNIHGAHLLFGNFVEKIKIINEKGDSIYIRGSELEFEYNHSALKSMPYPIVEVVLNLPLGNVEKAKSVSQEWIQRKSFQPQNSIGCIFGNITPEEQEKFGLENLSSSFILDKVLNVRGFRIGGAWVYEGHANFIVTDKTATAKDYLAVIEHIKQKAKDKIGLELKEEVVKVGEF